MAASDMGDVSFKVLQTASGQKTLMPQFGTEVIKSASVDGMPVVTIPDVSGLDSSSIQSAEAVSAAASLAAQTASMDQQNSSAQVDSPGLSSPSDSTPLSPEGPRVITQSLPSIKANHGFDILTQGILGGQQPRLPPKTGRSLLTGAITSLESFSPPQVPIHSDSSSPGASLGATPLSVSGDVSPLSNAASRTHHSLTMGQAVTQDEIQTLIQAAEAAAKPAKKDAQPIKNISEEIAKSLDTEAVLESENKSTEVVESEPKADLRERRVISVDESARSVAERYRMPAELFEPDEESPEKPMRPNEEDKPSSSNRLMDLPAALFNESGEGQSLTSPQRVESLASPQAGASSGLASPQTGEGLASPQRVEEPMEASVEEEVSLASPSLPSPPAPSQKGTKKGKKGAKKGRGRRKSKSMSASEDNEDVPAPSRPVEVPDAYPPLNTSSVGGFATDLLAEAEAEEKAKPKEASTIPQAVEPSEVTPPDEPSESRETLKPNGMETVQEGVEEKPSAEEAEPETKKEDDQKPDTMEPECVQKTVFPGRRRYVYLPAVITCRKEKASWTEVEEEDSDDEERVYEPGPFNYRVLVGKVRKLCPRHASLGPKEESYTAPLQPLPETVPKSERDVDLGSKPAAVVKRRCGRSEGSGSVARDWKVTPLELREDDDPAVLGGCQVRVGELEHCAPLRVPRGKGGNHMVDWATNVFMEEEREEQEDWDQLFEGMSAQEIQRQFCAQLRTTLYIQAGDFSSLVYDSPTPEESVKEEVPAHTVGQEDKSSEAPKVSKKRKRSSGEPARADKRARSSQSSEGDWPSSQEDWPHSPPVNGVDKLASPSHPSQDSDSPTRAGSSPARRSGRSHIPSKKVLDALEDSPVPRSKAGRKPSLPASEDDGSGDHGQDTGAKLKLPTMGPL